MTTLDDSSLPASFRSADLASLRGQRFTLRYSVVSLALGLAAALAGLATWRVGKDRLDLAAAAGSLAFAGSLVALVRLQSEDVGGRWYRGRAAAESIRTLAWRYAVAGNPFPESSAQPEDEFLDALDSILKRTGSLDMPVTTGEQISAAMRSMRAATRQDRYTAYVEGRIDEQARWYRRQATRNEERATRWGRVTVAAVTCGLLGGLAKTVGWHNVDLLGMAAAVAGSATAWTQLRQHRTLALSYGMAAQELSLARDRLRPDLTADRWADAVAAVEEAISREHSQWLARRTPG